VESVQCTSVSWKVDTRSTESFILHFFSALSIMLDPPLFPKECVTMYRPYNLPANFDFILAPGLLKSAREFGV